MGVIPYRKNVEIELMRKNRKELEDEEKKHKKFIG